MKRNFLMLMVIGLLLGGSLVARVTAEQPKNERAFVQINEAVKFRGVFLRGRYLFVHDAEKMAKGEDCTWIYDASGRLVTSFHCEPVERPKADAFKMIVSHRTGSFDISEVREIQFAGSTEGHLVP